MYGLDTSPSDLQLTPPVTFILLSLAAPYPPNLAQVLVALALTAGHPKSKLCSFTSLVCLEHPPKRGATHYQLNGSYPGVSRTPCSGADPR